MKPAMFTWVEITTAEGELLHVMQPTVKAQVYDQYTLGGHYQLAVEQERNLPQQRALYAEFNEVYKQLPEHITTRFKNQNHFRYWCLVKCDYVTNYMQLIPKKETDIPRYISWATRLNDYVIAQEHNGVIDAWTAKSQKQNSMNAKEFVKSMEDIINFARSYIGVTAEELTANAGMAA